jgi:hypothetical protein
LGRCQWRQARALVRRTPAVVAEGSGGSACQTEPFIDLLEQQNATIANDVAAIEFGLDNTPSKSSRFGSLIGTLWHRQSSDFIGFSYL